MTRNRVPFRNRMKGQIDVWWRKTESIKGNISIPTQSYIGGYLGLPFRNRMKGYFDIVAPKRITGVLNPLHDTFVSEANPYSIYGSSNNILVGYNNGMKYEGLLKFNVQELFPMYNKDSYILIDSVLKLTISNTRDVKDGDLDFYEVSLGDWKENSTTWSNKPIRSNTLTSFYRVEGDENNKGNVNIYIDMNKLVPKWLENPRKNNGIFIEARDDINNIVSFYSKENGDMTLNPQLLITYIDLNSPFLVKNSYLDSTLNVWENKTSLISSELEVEVRQSTSAIPSKLLVLNKPGDLLASLEITKDRLTCELNVIGDHISSELAVYSQETSRLVSSLYINQISMENELRISKLYDIEADLTVGKGKYTRGFLGINANRLINRIDFVYESNIESNIDTLAVNYIQNELYSIHLDSLDNEIVVDNGRRIIGDLEVIVNAYTYGDIFYGRFSDASATLGIAPYSYLDSEVGVQYGSNMSNKLTTLSVGYVDNDLFIVSEGSLLNDISISYFAYTSNMLNILNEFIDSEIAILDVENLESTITVQGWTLVNTLSVSEYSPILSHVNIPINSPLRSYVLVLNEKLNGSLNVYVNKKEYLDSEIHALAVKNINATINYQYSSTIGNEMIVFVDKISVLNAYLEIYNEDWEYEQRRGYGYIM